MAVTSSTLQNENKSLYGAIKCMFKMVHTMTLNQEESEKSVQISTLGIVWQND